MQVYNVNYSTKFTVVIKTKILLIIIYKAGKYWLDNDKCVLMYSIYLDM